MRRTLASAVICVSLLCLSFESFAAAFAFDNDNAANAHRRITKARKYKKSRKYRKYRQWRRYRARLARQRALRARRRAARSRRVRTAVAPWPPAAPAIPFLREIPAGWKVARTNGSEVIFTTDGGRGSAAVSVIGDATGETVDAGRHRKIGGVATTSLRRGVIERMVREQGWVVNDYQKVIGGRSVYVVVAESPAKTGETQSRMYYFTEAEGRIYSVSTSSPLDVAERIAAQSAEVISSIKPRTAQQAAIRE